MKLLMVSGDRSLMRGIRGAFYYTLEELQKHWDRVDVICPAARNKPFSAEGHQVEGLDKVWFHPSPTTLLGQASWIFKKGVQLIQEYQHDVMTVHEYPPFYNGIGARRLYRRTGIPYIEEIHHIVGWPKAASLPEAIGYVMSRLFLPSLSKKAKAIRTVNDTVARKLSAWGIAKRKIEIVPSFYLDRKLLGASYEITPQHDVVFCGRLVRNKNLASLIDAIAKLPKVTLLVIGDGPERHAMERRVKSRRIADRVTFRGWLPTHEKVIETLHEGRVFVMCSKSEGGPRVALEAMAVGRPVIVTPVGVMTHVIHDGVNGVLTDGTPADLAEKISELLADEEERISLGAKAKHVLQEYERSSLIKQYASFLQSYV